MRNGMQGHSRRNAIALVAVGILVIASSSSGPRPERRTVAIDAADYRAERAPRPHPLPRLEPRMPRAQRSRAPRPAPAPKGPTHRCKASWYGDALAGRRTASGEVFDPDEFTVATASRQIRFGTVLVVAYQGRVVRVRVTDRMGARDPADRCLDLSEAAFARLAPTSRGVITVIWREE